MRPQTCAIVILYAVSIVLGITGVVYLNDSIDRTSSLHKNRAMLCMISGMTMLVLGSAFLITATILTFKMGGKNDSAT